VKMDLKTEVRGDHLSYATMVAGISRAIMNRKAPCHNETRLQAMMNSTATTAKAFGVSKEQLLSEMSERYDKVGA